MRFLFYDSLVIVELISYILSFNIFKHREIIKLFLKTKKIELISKGFLLFSSWFFLVIIKTKKEFSILINIKYYLKNKNNCTCWTHVFFKQRVKEVSLPNGCFLDEIRIVSIVPPSLVQHIRSTKLRFSSNVPFSSFFFFCCSLP